MKKESIYFTKQCFKDVGVKKIYFLVISHRTHMILCQHSECVCKGGRKQSCSGLSPIFQFEFLNKQFRSVSFSLIVYLSSIYIYRLVFCAKCDHNFGLKIVA